MHFFTQNYNYIIFLSGWAYLCLAIAFLPIIRTKIWKSFYSYLMLYAVCMALIKFISTFSYGTITSHKSELLLLENYIQYIGQTSFFLGALISYKNINKLKFKKIFIFSCLAIPILSYFMFGLSYFRPLMFFYLFLPGILFSLNTVYTFYRKKPDYKNRILSIFASSIYCACGVFFFEIISFFKVNSINFLAISELLVLVGIMFTANITFKYFKISKEQFTKIYDYIPFIWKHIPIATTLTLIFLVGFVLSNYLETNSKNAVITKANDTILNIAETTSMILNSINDLSLSLAHSPLLKQALVSPSKGKIAALNTMLDYYKDSFDVSLIFALTHNNKIFTFHDNSDKKTIQLYKENSDFFKLFKNNCSEGSITNRIFITKDTYYLAPKVTSKHFDTTYTVVMKVDLNTLRNKLKMTDNIFIANKDGNILISNNSDNFPYKLWKLSSTSYPVNFKDLNDHEIITIDNEQFYISRKILNDEMWSMMQFTTIGIINPAKIFDYLITSALVIIAMLLFWIISQYQKNLAFALQNQAILNSLKLTMILTTDLDGEIITFSQGMQYMTGYSKDNLSDDYFQTIFFDKNERSITFKKAVSNNLKLNLEWTCRKKNGNFINILMNITTQLSNENKIIGYIFSATDISKNKKIESALAQQLQFLKALLDNIPAAIYYRDSSMKFLDCNKTFELLIEHRKNSLIGTTAEDIFFDKNTSNISTNTDLEISTSMKPISYELSTTINDKQKNIVFYKSAFSTIKGHFNGIITVIIDVTKERALYKEKNILQNKLIQQNKLVSLGELASSIAHELNNPLSIILGFTKVSLRDTTLNKKLNKNLSNIYKSALRSQTIIRNMLDFSRRDPARTVGSKLETIIEKTLPMIEKSLNSTNIEIVKNLNDTDILINVNPMQIQQVLINLILNAKDAMPNGGIITISTILSQNSYILSIADTGVGINKKNITKVFEPFFTTKDVGKGTGLGLSISYGIIQNMKGEISVESELGKGTIFYVKFPASLTK